MSNNQKVVCFSCHQKGHYANACPAKALRAAANASNQEMTTMSREERLFIQAVRLPQQTQDNDYSQGGMIGQQSLQSST